MHKLAALALVTAPLLASGCMNERVYDTTDGIEPALIAELFGQAGVLRPIEEQFPAERAQAGAFALYDSITVSDYGSDVYASMFVQEPEGRAYVDVSVERYQQMEVGRAYTVTLQGDADSGYYTDSDVARDEPIITVYACPEDVNGPTGQSGNAQEVTVVRDLAPNGGSVFTFQAEADNPRQQLFLDGWFRSSPASDGGL